MNSPRQPQTPQLADHFDKDDPLLLYTPPLAHELTLLDSPASTASSFTPLSAHSSPITSTNSSPTPRRTVHFIDRPSPIEDDALDNKILTVLAAEDRFGFFATLTRLLERPLALVTPDLIQPHTAFAVELNHRLRELSTSSMLHSNPRRWSISPSDPPSRIKTTHGSELCLLELISSRLEARDSNQKRPSLNLDSLGFLAPPEQHDDMDDQWLAKAGHWVLDTLSFVPWKPIAQA